MELLNGHVRAHTLCASVYLLAVAFVLDFICSDVICLAGSPICQVVFKLSSRVPSDFRGLGRWIIRSKCYMCQGFKSNFPCLSKLFLRLKQTAVHTVYD